MSDTAIPDEWEQVKTEWGKANKLAMRLFMQAAQVGQMLMDLKGKQASGNFRKRAKNAALPFEYRHPLQIS